MRTPCGGFVRTHDLRVGKSRAKDGTLDVDLAGSLMDRQEEEDTAVSLPKASL